MFGIVRSVEIMLGSIKGETRGNSGVCRACRQ